MLAKSVNPDLIAFQERNKITLTTDTSLCSFHIFVGPWSKFSNCDRAKDFLTKAGLSFETVHRPNVSNELQIGETTTIKGFDAKRWNEALAALNFPAKADPNKIHWPKAMTILTIFLIYVAMVYGPIAAFLVELFPTRIRFTSMSLPYHIGNGWFGGMLPLLATAIVAWTGNIYAGLYYPIGIALMTVVIGYLFLDETNDVNIAQGSGVEAREARVSNSWLVLSLRRWGGLFGSRLRELAVGRALLEAAGRVQDDVLKAAQGWLRWRAHAHTQRRAEEGATPYASVCTLIRTNAIVFALAIALAVPAVIGAVWYTKLLQTNEIKAHLHAYHLAALAENGGQQPGPSLLLGIFSSSAVRPDDVTRVRMMNADGDVIRAWGPAIDGFSVVAKSPVVVRGETIGHVETSTGAAALLYTMLVLVVLNSIVAAVAYLGVTKTPIQALHEISEKLTEHEQDLAEKNAQLDAALANMVQGLCLLDADQKVVVANQRYAEIYSLTPEEIKPGLRCSRF